MKGLNIFPFLAGVPCTRRNSKGRVRRHTNERKTPACPIRHTLCSSVCEEPVTVCFQWAIGGSFLTVWHGGKGHRHRWWPRALHRQGYRWVCVQTRCQKGPGPLQWGRFPTHSVSEVKVQKTHFCITHNWYTTMKDTLLICLLSLAPHSGHPDQLS